MAILYCIFWGDGETASFLLKNNKIRGREIPNLKWKVRYAHKGVKQIEWREVSSIEEKLKEEGQNIKKTEWTLKETVRTETDFIGTRRVSFSWL